MPARKTSVLTESRGAPPEPMEDKKRGDLKNILVILGLQWFSSISLLCHRPDKTLQCTAFAFALRCVAFALRLRCVCIAFAFAFASPRQGTRRLVSIQGPK